MCRDYLWRIGIETKGVIQTEWMVSPWRQHCAPFLFCLFTVELVLLFQGYYMHFPHSSVGKESACNSRDRFNPWVGKIRWRRARLLTPVFLGFSCDSAGRRSPGEGKGYPPQYSDLKNPMDYIVHGVAKSWTSWMTFAFTFTFTSSFSKTAASAEVMLNVTELFFIDSRSVLVLQHDFLFK